MINNKILKKEDSSEMIAQTEEEDSELDVNRNTLISPVGPPLTNIQETGIKN